MPIMGFGGGLHPRTMRGGAQGRKVHGWVYRIYSSEVRGVCPLRYNQNTPHGKQGFTVRVAHAREDGPFGACGMGISNGPVSVAHAHAHGCMYDIRVVKLADQY